MLSNLSSIKENQIVGEIALNSPHILLLISRCCVNVDFGLLLIDHLLPVVFRQFCCAHMNISFIQEKAGRNKTAVPGSLSACGVVDLVQDFGSEFNAAFPLFASSQSPGARQSDIHTPKTTSTGIFRENNTHKLLLQQCFSLYAFLQKTKQYVVRSTAALQYLMHCGCYHNIFHPCFIARSAHRKTSFLDVT